MSARTAVAGTASVGVLVGVLGSPAIVHQAQDLAERHRIPLAASTLTDIPNWDVFAGGTTADVVWGVVLKLGVLFVVVALLTALAGRASHGAAFLAGWGSLVVAAGLAGAVDFAYRDAVLGTAPNPFDASYFDYLVGATNLGAGFGLWTGWTVGAAVAVAASVRTRPALRPGVATGPIARSPGRAPITPPAPWWAADASPLSPVAYNAPSVFPELAQEGPPTVDAATHGTAGDLDLNSTLATPLARLGDDTERTRPIPSMDATAPNGAVTDPTAVKPALANPGAADPELAPGHHQP
jgi:hypothetical protein